MLKKLGMLIDVLYIRDINMNLEKYDLVYLPNRVLYAIYWVLLILFTVGGLLVDKNLTWLFIIFLLADISWLLIVLKRKAILASSRNPPIQLNQDSNYCNNTSTDKENYETIINNDSNLIHTGMKHKIDNRN